MNLPVSDHTTAHFAAQVYADCSSLPVTTTLANKARSAGSHHLRPQSGGALLTNGRGENFSRPRRVYSLEGNAEIERKVGLHVVVGLITTCGRDGLAGH